MTVLSKGPYSIYSYVATFSEDIKYSLFQIYGGKVSDYRRPCSTWGSNLDNSWFEEIKRR